MKHLVYLSIVLFCYPSFSAEAAYGTPQIIGNTTPFHHTSFSSATYGNDGTIYVTHITRDPKTNGSDLFDVISTEIYAYSQDTRLWKKIVTYAGSSSDSYLYVRALAFEGGHLYVATPKKIDIFDGNGSFQRSYGENQISKDSWYHGVAVSASTGNVFAAVDDNSLNAPQIYIFSPSGSFLKKFPIVDSYRVNHFKLTSDEHVVVNVDTSKGDETRIYNSDGSLIWKSPDKFSSVFGVSRRGEIYVQERLPNLPIHILNSSGALIATACSKNCIWLGGGGKSDISVSPSGDFLVSHNDGINFYGVDGKRKDTVADLYYFEDFAADDSHIYSPSRKDQIEQYSIITGKVDKTLSLFIPMSEYPNNSTAQNYTEIVSTNLDREGHLSVVYNNSEIHDWLKWNANNPDIAVPRVGVFDSAGVLQSTRKTKRFDNIERYFLVPLNSGEFIAQDFDGAVHSLKVLSPKLREITNISESTIKSSINDANYVGLDQRMATDKNGNIFVRSLLHMPNTHFYIRVPGKTYAFNKKGNFLRSFEVSVGKCPNEAFTGPIGSIEEDLIYTVSSTEVALDCEAGVYIFDSNGKEKYRITSFPLSTLSQFSGGIKAVVTPAGSIAILDRLYRRILVYKRK
ncbi:MAG: hypothetical protein AABY64_04635 [Bdellovibrionota bacterium]